jgi:hypothetical protein
MSHTATLTAGLATLPDPPRDRDARPMPARIAEILDIAGILAAYGRHLADTIEHRAVWRGFATIAQFFGTAAIAVILPHLRRGIMRAVALQRVLLARAGRRRDLVILARRVHAPRAAAPPAPPPAELLVDPQAASAAEPPPAAAPPAQQPARPVRRSFLQELLSLDTMPSMEAIEAEVRRRPVGQTIAAICRDLGIAPTLCEGGFWNRLFDAIRWYGGSLGNVMLEMRRREKLLEQEQDRHPTVGLPELTREAARRVLGFRIGEPPVDPHRPEHAPVAPAAVTAPGAPVAATATGPP